MLEILAQGMLIQYNVEKFNIFFFPFARHSIMLDPTGLLEARAAVGQEQGHLWGPYSDIERANGLYTNTSS
jgi:hypothetical protein